jgi:hypothetical protein
MHRWGLRLGRNSKMCPCGLGDCLSLEKMPEGGNAIIICNSNLNTIERGLYQGAQISMFRNAADEPNIIVAAGDARYVLDRRIAKAIRIRIVA